MGRINVAGSAPDWVYPSDWIDVRNPANGTIEILVNDIGLSAFAFICTTVGTVQYTVDWGDGVVLNYNSNTKAEHAYTVGAGQACNRGYTTFKIVISGPLLTFKIVGHSASSKSQLPQVLAASFNSNTITSLSNAFYSSSGTIVYCKSLEYVRIVSANALTNLQAAFQNCTLLTIVDLCSLNALGSTTATFQNCNALIKISKINMPAVTTANNMFMNCTSLKSIDVRSMVSVTNAQYMFQNCAQLKSIDVSQMVLVTDAGNMFGACASLESIDVSALVKVTSASNIFYGCAKLRNVNISGFNLVTNASYMFYSCQELKTVDISNMSGLTKTDYMFADCFVLDTININNLNPSVNASYMFSNCYLLKNIASENFGIAGSDINLDSAFVKCEEIKNLNLSNARITKIAAAGQVGSLNKLETFTFHPLSTFSGSSPQINLSYNTLTAAQINVIFTALPTVTSKTIVITGCTGAATCTRTIATTKGWTVTG